VNLYREGTIYVQKRTLKRLKWIRQAGGAEGISVTDHNKYTGELYNRGMTLDEMADKLLNEYLEQKYPGLIPAEKLYNKAEDQAIETIKTTVAEPRAREKIPSVD
jgi:hypothetical protein